MTLKSIEEHNAERSQKLDLSSGAACPMCGWELHYLDSHRLLPTIPRKRSVSCPHCRWRGSILA